MADFDNFEASFNNEAESEVDPAAEFLAREQDELAGLEDDLESFDQGLETSISNEAINGTNNSGIVNHFEDSQMNGPMEPPTMLSITRTPREEPEKIKKWREDQQKSLQEKDKEEALKKEELQGAAKRELEDWYARYKEQIEKSKQTNRNAEKEWVAERDAEVPGQEWEKIAKLCDFNPKSSRNSKDTSRMRSIILQLKQSPPVRKS